MPELTPGFLGGMAALGAVAILVMVFFYLNLYGLLKEVGEQNRRMPPNHVWLNFIPLFNWYWMIMTVVRVRDSVEAEFRERGLRANGDFGYGVGLAYAVISIFSSVSSFGRFYGSSTALAPLFAVGGVVSLVGLACWVIYWMRTAELKRALRTSIAASGDSTSPASGPGLPVEQTGSSSDQAADSEDEADAEDTVGYRDGVCPSCGTPYRSNATKYCSYCGKPAV